MGGFPPGFEKYKDEVSTPEYYVILTVVWVILLIYASCFAILVANAWQILIKQGRWRNLPLLLFYIFSAAAIVLRELIMFIRKANCSQFLYYFTDLEQPYVKLGAGLVQVWIIFEVALWIREGVFLDSNPSADRTKNQRWIRNCQIGTMVLISLIVIALTVMSSYATKTDPDAGLFLELHD